MDMRMGWGTSCFSPFFAQAALFRSNTAVLAACLWLVRPSLYLENSGDSRNSKNILNKKFSYNLLK